MYKKFLDVESARKYMLPILEDSEIQCALCDRKFKGRILSGHLRVHREKLIANRRVKWYRPKKQKYEPSDTEAECEFQEEDLETSQQQFEQRPETMSETYQRLFGGTSCLNACIKKLLDLYHPKRNKWLRMEPPIPPNDATWYEVTSESQGFIPSRLCNGTLREHLLFKCTVSVWNESKYSTSFLTWDVDVGYLPNDPDWDPTREAQNATIAIASILTKWGLHPHVNMSGGKGYHITVFFKEAITLGTAMSLFKAVLQHPKGPKERPGLKVECLPIQRANKLPLGIHFHAQRFTGYVHPFTLQTLDDPYQYLLNIVPDSSHTLYKIHDEELAGSRQRQSTILMEEKWQKEQTESAYFLGITEPHTRHDTLLKVAAFIRNRQSLCPSSLVEFTQMLIDWSRKQYKINKDNISTSWSDHLQEVDYVTRYAWKHPITSGVCKKIVIKSSVVHWIRCSTPVLASQRLMLAAWFRCAIVGIDFYFGYQDMQKMTKLANDSLDKAIKELRDRGILEIVRNYFNSADGIFPSRTTKYRFSSLPDSSSMDAALLVVTAEQWDPSLWFRLLRTLFTNEQLKEFYKFAYHRILSVEPLPIGRVSA